MKLKNLARLPDWDRRLARVVERHRQTPMAWGECDCLLAAADAVQAVTGQDPAEKIRGKYETEAGAGKLLRRRKHANVEEALAALFPPVGRLRAERGDLCTVEREGVLSAGYITEYGAAVKTATGLAFIPQTAIRAAFKVG